MTIRTTLICPLITAAALVCGCAQQATTLDSEFGDSVRNVMQSQVHDPEAAANPDPNAVEGADPYRLDTALGVHRGDVAQPQQVQQPISINVGSR